MPEDGGKEFFSNFIDVLNIQPFPGRERDQVRKCGSHGFNPRLKQIKQLSFLSLPQQRIGVNHRLRSLDLVYLGGTSRIDSSGQFLLNTQ